MKNKNGAMQLAAIVPIIIYFIFQFWAGNLIADAIEPELEKALNSLDGRIICPPEFKTQSYDVCFNAMGDVIVTGKVAESFSIRTDFGSSVYIVPGNYDSSIVGIIRDMEKINNLVMVGNSIGSSSIHSSQLIKYSGNLLYLKKPIKTGIWIFRKIKYIPIL